MPSLAAVVGETAKSAFSTSGSITRIATVVVNARKIKPFACPPSMAIVVLLLIPLFFFWLWWCVCLVCFHLCSRIALYPCTCANGVFLIFFFYAFFFKPFVFP